MAPAWRVVALFALAAVGTGIASAQTPPPATLLVRPTELTRKQVEGIRASGGTALHEIRFGLMPQVLPVIAGQVLYFIESNTRSATIIGIVGAGGIGLQLAEQIRVLEWQKVSFLILMILVAVAAIDWISGKLRFAIIGQRAVA